MKYDKKSKEAKLVKNKILRLIKAKENLKEDLKQIEWSKGIVGYYCPELIYTTEDSDIVCRWYNGKYLTPKQKDILLQYLIDCLVDDEAFDLSTLGPNEYLQEGNEL